MSFRHINLAHVASAVTFPVWMTGRAMRVFIAGLILAAVAGYLLQINRMSTSGYQMHSLEKEIAVVMRETQRLETEVASYQSLASINKRLAELQMVPVASIKYVKNGGESVAKR